MTAIPRKQNAPGYIDEQGRFRPIRSPQYIGSGASKRKATVRDKKKYSRAKAGDLGKARQERALEAPWDREYRLEQEAAAADAKERARIEKEIEADVYGETSGRMSSGKAQSLAQFVRGQGGINAGSRTKRGRKVYGDLENFTRKDSGTTGLVTTVKGKGKGLDTMWQLARQSGFDLVSSDDLLDRLDDEIRSGKMTYATHGSLTYNPVEVILWGHRKGDPDWAEEVITTKAENHAAAKKWAKENGFDRFRVSRLDLSKPPDFKGTVRKNPAGRQVAANAADLAKARKLGRESVGLSGQAYWDNWNAFRDLRFTKTFSIAALKKLHDAFDQAAGKSSRAKLGIKRNPAGKVYLSKYAAFVTRENGKVDQFDILVAGTTERAIKESAIKWLATKKKITEFRDLLLNRTPDAGEWVSSAAARRRGVMIVNPARSGTGKKAAGRAKKNPIKVLLHKFHVGQKLAARSIGDHNIIYRGQVVSRTPKFVVLKIEGERDLKRCGVSRWENTEVVYPFGRYSMAPSFRAKDGDRVGNPAGTGKKAAGRAKVNPTVTAAERAGLVKFFKTLGMDGMAADVKAGGDPIKALKQSVGLWKSQPKMQAKMRQLVRMLEAKRNPARKKNPLDLIGTFANLAVGISSAMHIDEAMKRRSRRPAAKRRGTTKAKTTARRNPARMSTVKAKGGNLYVLTIQRGDDEVGIYLHDGNANGFSKEVKTLAAARAYAKRTGRKLVENPKANPSDRWFKVGRVWFLDTKNGIARISPNAAGGKDVYRVHVQGRHSTWTANVQTLANAKKEGAHWLGTMINPAGSGTGKKAAARSKANPANKKGITIGDSNIRLVGFGKDRNGNSTVRVKYPNSGVFSIQTNGNLPATHGLRSKSLKWLDSRDMRSIERELIEYIRAFGSAKQKSGLRVPNPRPSAKTPRAARKNPKGFHYAVWGVSEKKASHLHNATTLAGAMKEAKTRAADRGETVTVRRLEGNKIIAFVPAPARKNPAKPKARKPKVNAARVPARRTFEMFQGRPATTARRLAVSRHAPARLDQLGDLIEVKLNSGKVLDFSKRNFKLCAAGGKLWIAGGKIAKPNPAAAANEINPIDSIDHVVYGTRKPHHGDHEYTHYIHRLGEESGHMPTLCADREGFPIIRGGKYKIEARGIVN